MTSGLVAVGSRRYVLASWLDSERRSLDVLRAKIRGADGQEYTRLRLELEARSKEYERVKAMLKFGMEDKI